MTLFVIDIDGTIADASRRFAKAGLEPKKRGAAYTKWLKKVQSPKELMSDKPVKGTRDLVNSCFWAGKTVYLTARSEIYRNVTYRWLSLHHFTRLPLYMRPKRNRQDSGTFKERVIKQLVKDNRGITNVILFDDDPTGSIEAVSHKNGWTFFKSRTGGY